MATHWLFQDYVFVVAIALLQGYFTRSWFRIPESGKITSFSNFLSTYEVLLD